MKRQHVAKLFEVHNVVNSFSFLRERVARMSTVSENDLLARSVRNASAVFTWLVLLSPCFADWSTYKFDNARSGATAENAPANPVENWVYRAPNRPIAAWDEPALWDGWAKVHDLTNRQTFDKAFHVVVLGDFAYFGSSVDDKVYCLDAATGRTKWEFFTEGPVRLAPTVTNGRVYVGSDDGFVYCLDARTGALIWKHRPGLTSRRIPGNGRIISPWAIRTGIVVVGDRLYCGSGVIPSETVFVCALDANTGNEIWKTAMNDLPAQGYMLASKSRVYVVTSRDRPVVFEADTGKRLAQVAGGAGGTFALLTGDTLLYGPGKTGDVNMIGSEKHDVLASFSGHHMIVSNPLSFLHKGTTLSALDRPTYVELYGQRRNISDQKAELTKQLDEAKKKKEDAKAQDLMNQIKPIDEQIKKLTQQLADCVKWSTECDCHLSMILAGEKLIAGGEGRVLAFDAKTGDDAWSLDVPGKVYGLAVSDGRLFVSTDDGAIHCFSNQENNSPPNGLVNTETKPQVRRQDYQGPFVSSKDAPHEVHGPFAEFVAPNTVRISWDTAEPATSMLEFGPAPEHFRTWNDATKKMQHEFVVDQVQRDVVHRFRVSGELDDGRRFETEPYQFDSHFDYLPISAPNRENPYPADSLTDQYDKTAKQMLELAATLRGYALVLGSKDGRLAYHLARNSDLKIVVVEPDEGCVAKARSMLDAAGLYGTRVSVHHAQLDTIPYGPFTWNLIVSDRMLFDEKLPGTLSGLERCLRPAGGVIVLGAWDSGDPRQQSAFTSYREAGTFDGEWHQLDFGGGSFWVNKRNRLEGTGEWTHQYGHADNSACSKDDRIRGEMMVQWWGRPGARPMPDRGNRNPAPVSAAGRMFVQGNRTLFGMDAYNGTILWSKQIPTMRRANMPRDGSNMVATDEYVLVALGGSCVAFDAQTGERKIDYAVPESERDQLYDWGYLSSDGRTLLGSGVRRGSQYMGDQGEWYEGFAAKDTARVTSDFLFAADQYSGEKKWNYTNGVLMNSTITIGDGVIYFIESRSGEAKSAKSGRLLDEVFQDQVLVALDHQSGKILWEKPFDFSKCKFVTYLTYGDGTLLVTGTDRDSIFHTYAFDAGDGSELWQHDAPDKKGHHTGQLAHPTIVGQRVYFNKHTYDLKTGKVLAVTDFNWHGCGVMSASNHTVFSRYEYHGMYDLQTNERTEFLGIRSGCWLSLIPSGGLLLAPETSAGCSCGHSLQTSIAYVPKEEWTPVDTEVRENRPR